MRTGEGGGGPPQTEIYHKGYENNACRNLKATSILFLFILCRLNGLCVLDSQLPSATFRCCMEMGCCLLIISMFNVT